MARRSIERDRYVRVRPPLLRSFYAGSFAIGASTSEHRHAPVSAELMDDVRERIAMKLPATDAIRVDPGGHVSIRMTAYTSIGARARMRALTGWLVQLPFFSGGELLHLDVGASWTRLTHNEYTNSKRMLDLRDEAQRSLRNRDLSVRPGQATGPSPRLHKSVTPAVIVAALVLSFAVPLLIMRLTWAMGFDISNAIYYLVVAAMLVMAGMQFIEGLAALRQTAVPPKPRGVAPRATAIIAAYLPNEAATIMETLESFLAQKYSGGLQIILAYNSPVKLPIEAELQQLADAHPNLLVLKVADSRSKADNVNAALGSVEGEFVGIFDADHHPMEGAFERAWRWIADGVGIVQGHCLIRNGDDAGIARMVAAEFEQIYAVNHPGRARLQGFGIFGGSNGYWSTQLFREIRFRSSFLTEDIDSAIRAVRSGARIVNDPGLVSRELAPVQFKALWKQRMRWAQGWFQVSLRHGHATLAERSLGRRQRVGFALLLGWRELFPWVASLMWPTLTFAVIKYDGLPPLVPILVACTIVTIASGPIQIAFAYRLADVEIKRRGRWWLQYLLFSVFFYQEVKSLLVRIAHVREFLRQDEWVVTPRGHVERVTSPPLPNLSAHALAA